MNHNSAKQNNQIKVHACTHAVHACVCMNVHAYVHAYCIVNIPQGLKTQCVDEHARNQCDPR